MKIYKLILKSCFTLLLYFIAIFSFNILIAQDNQNITLKVSKETNSFDVKREENATYPTISSAIEHAIPGDTIEILEGTYKENIIIDKKIHLKGQDVDKTIIEPISSNFTITIGNKKSGEKITDLSGSIIENLTIKTINNYTEEKACINLQNFKNTDKITIKNNKFVGDNKYNILGYGIYSSTKNKDEFLLIKNLYITHNQFENFKNALNFNALNDSVIECNTIKNINLSAINISSNYNEFNNITIENNKVENCSINYKYSPTLCGAVNLSNNITNVNITNNTFIPKEGPSIILKANAYGKVPKDITIYSNKLYGNIQNYLKSYTLDCSKNYIKDMSNTSKNIIFSPFYTDEELTKLSNQIFSLEFSQPSLILNKDEIFYLTYNLNSGPEASKDVVWKSYNENIATVEDGKITAKSSGNTLISLKCDQKEIFCPISVCVINKNGENIEVDANIPELVLSPNNTKDNIAVDIYNKVNIYTPFETFINSKDDKNKSLAKNPYDITIPDSILNNIDNLNTNKNININLSLPKNTLINNIKNTINSISTPIETNVIIPDDIYRKKTISLTKLEVDKSVFEQAKKDSKSLLFNVKDQSNKILYSWTFNELNNFSNLNLAINVKKIEESNLLSSFTKNNNCVELDFKNNDTLTNKAKINIFLGNTDFSTTDKLYLYYYNEKNNNIEFISKDIKVENDLYSSFEISHTSKYILSTSLLKDAVNNPNPSTNMMIIYSISLIAFISLIPLFIRKFKITR